MNVYVTNNNLSLNIWGHESAEAYQFFRLQIYSLAKENPSGLVSLHTFRKYYRHARPSVRQTLFFNVTNIGRVQFLLYPANEHTTGLISIFTYIQHTLLCVHVRATFLFIMSQVYVRHSIFNDTNIGRVQFLLHSLAGILFVYFQPLFTKR